MIVSTNISKYFILASAIASLVFCVIVLVSAMLDKSASVSNNLQLILRLLLSNCGQSFVIIIYYILVESNSFNVNQQTVCSIYLPTQMFFFLSGYGWAIMLAIRFQYSHNTETVYRQSVPFYCIWLVSIAFVLPTVIVNIINNPSISIISSTPFSCTYNHELALSVIVHIISIQIPLFVTILLCTSSYVKGLLAVKDAPQSVVARLMRRAGGYLLVLLLVWTPNIAFDVLSVISSSNSEYSGLFTIGICLISIQVYFFIVICSYQYIYAMNSGFFELLRLYLDESKNKAMAD